MIRPRAFAATAFGLLFAGLLCLLQAQAPTQAQCISTMGAGGKCKAGGGAPAGFTLIADVASAGVNAQTTSVRDTTGANFIAVVVFQFSGVTIGTLTDSKSNTWTGLTAKTGANAYVRIYYSTSPTVGSGHTFTYDNGTFILGGLGVQAWSGANVSPFDVENGATETISLTSLQTGSVTPSQDNSLIITGLAMNGAGTSGTSINGGYTITMNFDDIGGVHIGGAMAYLVQTSAAATNPTWSWTTGADAAAVIAVFKP